MNKNLQSLQPNVFEKGLDLYKKYSPLGMTIRGITSLANRVVGPRAVDYNDGYNMANISGPVSRDFGPEDGVGGDNISDTGILQIKEINPVGNDQEVEVADTSNVNDMYFNFGTFSNPIYKKDLV